MINEPPLVNDEGYSLSHNEWRSKEQMPEVIVRQQRIEFNGNQHIFPTPPPLSTFLLGRHA